MYHKHGSLQMLKTYEFSMELARLIHLAFSVTVASGAEGSWQKPGKWKFKSLHASVVIWMLKNVTVI